ncbi:MULTISPECIES: sensor histidine kinase [Winogradskyella]|uniref:tetratricopeptide repeat-containing sensor histidine kinase n=1 Tax=Winogradskyella TaxID=286104 RepID=UPI0015CC136C|nr:MULTISPECIES: sensor histidine kinase [Winogradskyella]QXP79384.1 sensor histidine kinase [Winogradskyella sp. HaHa_3_26]
MKYFKFTFFLFIFHLSFSQSDSIIDFGQKLIDDNKLDSALTYFEAHLLDKTSKTQEIKLLIGLAEIYKLKLDYNSANNYYCKALAVINGSNNKQLEFYYDVKMAEFYRKRTLFKEAEQHLDRATLLLKSHKIENKYLVKYYSRKAALFTEYYNNADSTFFYAEKALKLSKLLNDKDGVFSSTLEISGVYEENKNFDKTIETLENLIYFADHNNLIQNKVDAYINYTRVLIKDKQYNKALEESLKALDYAIKNELFYGEILFTDNIRNIYEKLGNTTKAYEYLKIRLRLTDKYYKLEHSKFLFELEEKYKLAEKENQIHINKLEIANKDKELSTNKTHLYISVSLFFSATLIALLTAIFFKRAKKDNKQLQFLSQQNEFLLSEANHRINNNLQLVIILISDQLKKPSEDTTLQFKNILSKVEAISTLHKHLYRNEDKQGVDIANYLEDVRDSFLDVFKEHKIKTNFSVDPINISSNYAMYFGLLLTELSINSIKHAFSSQEYKEINFNLKIKESKLYFKYSDNGTTATGKKLKLKLVDKLCRQLKIEYKIDTSKGFLFLFEKEMNNA